MKTKTIQINDEILEVASAFTVGKAKVIKGIVYKCFKEKPEGIAGIYRKEDNKLGLVKYKTDPITEDMIEESPSDVDDFDNIDSFMDTSINLKNAMILSEKNKDEIKNSIKNITSVDSDSNEDIVISAMDGHLNKIIKRILIDNNITFKNISHKFERAIDLSNFKKPLRDRTTHSMSWKRFCQWIDKLDAEVELTIKSKNDKFEPITIDINKDDQ